MYVLKRSFDWTNLSFFLLYFWLFLISWTIVQPIQVIIISFVYYYSTTFLWSFSYHLCVVYFWPACSHLSDQNSLILKLFLGFIADFLWAVSKPDIHICFPCRFVEGLGEGAGWVFRFFCCNLLLYFISNVLKFIHSRFILLISNLCVLYLLDQRSLILKLVLEFYCKFSVGRIQNRHIYLLPRRFVEGCGESLIFCYFACLHEYIDWLQNISSSLTFLVDCWKYIYKHHRRFSFCWVSI